VSLGYEKIIEETLRGTLLVDLAGVIPGQINGLSVFEFGKHLFGRASRITAVVRMGEGNVIDIEREIKMGGPIHSKGVLILSGFLKSRYAQDVPLSISASLVFEQSYGPIEGDSASLAELCALLSALSHVGIRQSIAVTGSVNQHGEVQPVGAINEKIEGFFDLCQRKGFSGEQGVVIPRSNLKHLALRDEVIEQIKLNKFTLYAVDTVDECLQILTGVPKQEMTEKIEAQLHTYSERLKKSKGPESGEEKKLSATTESTGEKSDRPPIEH
jgi:predicted ATP-dependent protease